MPSTPVGADIRFPSLILLACCAAAAILLPLTSSVMAQDKGAVITGRIIDARGIPLAGANVIVKGTLLGAATGADGVYVIRNVPRGPQQLQVSMLGFEHRDVRVDVDSLHQTIPGITLAETALHTGEVVVTAGRRPQSLEDVPVSMAVFDAHDISQRTITALDQALRYIPGVSMTESQINIRGSSGYSRAIGSRVLMLLDGVPLLTGDGGEIKYDAVPMYMVDRIEVVKGAGSALYGSSALGGVVNVITKRSDGGSFGVRAYSGFYDSPQYDGWKWWGRSPRYFNGADLEHHGRIGEASYLVSAGARNNQGYRQADDHLQWSAFGKVDLPFSGERAAGLTFNYAYDDHGSWLFWRDVQHALVPPAQTDLSERTRSTKLQTTLSWRETVGPAYAWTTRATWYRTAFDLRSDTSDYSLRPADRVESTSDMLLVNLQGVWVPAPGMVLTHGVDASLSVVDALAFGRRTGATAALYVQGDWAVADEVNVSVGARADYSHVRNADSDGRITPRCGVIWNIMPGTSVRASAGMGFRAPSIAERFTTASGSGIRTKPNPALVSERSASYEAGLRHEFDVPLVIDASVFLADYTNLVEPVIDTDGLIMFRNITRARISGAEMGVTSSLLDRHLTVSAGWTYMNPRDLHLNETLKYRPRHMLTAGASVQWSVFSLSADYRYQRRVERIDEELRAYIRDADARVDIHVVDARLSAALPLFDLPLTATLAVNNLLQYNYIEIVGNIAPIRHFMLTVETRW